MTVTEITVRAVSVPIRRPTRMSTRTLGARDYVLVEIADDAAPHPGVGYTYAGTFGGTVVAETVTAALAPALVGRPADDLGRTWDRLYQDLLMIGRRGAAIRALAAVDIALWDLLAKRAGLSLAALLGGTTATVPAYSSGGYYRPDDGPWAEAVAAEIRANRAAGFTDHKIKVGGLPVREDAERVAAAAGELGPGGRLGLDANNAYRDATEALAALRAFEAAAGAAGLWFFEEPLSADDVRGHARLAARADTTIATGEIHQTRWEFADLIRHEAAGLRQPDAGVLGGVTEWLRVAHAAEVFGLPVAPHWHHHLHAQLAAAAANCVAVEYFDLTKDIYNIDALIAPEHRTVARDGHLVLPDRPGTGLVFDDDRVDEHLVASARSAA